MTTVKTDLRPPLAITANPDESRAVLISKSLRAVARRARTPRNVIGSIGTQERRWNHVLAWAIILGFFIFVFVPTSVTAIYLGCFASDQYATETRFALRGGEPHILNQFGGLVAMPAAQRAQDSMILIDYIRGRGMVDAVNKTLNLRQLFARDNIDFFSRFNPKEADEELVYYWRRHVDVHVDSLSGIITLVVRAFTPQDSLNITNKVMQESENLVNDLSERASTDSLHRAELELTRAKANLQKKVAALRDLRNTEGIIDTSKTGNVMVQMIGELRLELIKLEQEYSAQRQTISPDAPQLKVLQARIDSMKDQILRVEGQMTGPVSPDKLTLANAMSSVRCRADRKRRGREAIRRRGRGLRTGSF